jgi:hypothetical protein
LKPPRLSDACYKRLTAFVLAVLIIVGWALIGPSFDARQAREQLKRGVLATDTPEVQATSLQHPAREMKGGRRAASLVLFDQAGTPLWSTALATQQGEARL